MSRSLARLVIAMVLVAAGLGVEPAAASSPQGAITWTVDHAAKTITVIARLQIYPGCSGDPYASNPNACVTGASASIVNQFLVDKIKKQIKAVWNKPYQYRCYTLLFDVDITLGTDISHIDEGYIGVRIDPSPGAGIRDFVSLDHPELYDPSRWQSNDPADRVVPTNDADDPTTWGEASQWERTVYAHEFGHVIGLTDAYKDVVDPNTGEVRSVPQPGAPRDLMSTLAASISQETIDRVVERNSQVLVDSGGNRVDLKDLKCDRYGFASSWPDPYGNHSPLPIGAVSCTADLHGKWAVITFGFSPPIDFEALIAAMNDSANRLFVGLWQAGEKGEITYEFGFDGVLTPSEGPPPKVTLDVSYSNAVETKHLHTQVYDLYKVEGSTMPNVCSRP